MTSTWAPAEGSVLKVQLTLIAPRGEGERVRTIRCKNVVFEGSWVVIHTAEKDAVEAFPTPRILSILFMDVEGLPTESGDPPRETMKGIKREDVQTPEELKRKSEAGRRAPGVDMDERIGEH